MKFNQSYGNTAVSAIHVGNDVMATVIPLKKEYFQGGMISKTLNAPAGFSVYFVDRNGNLSNDLAGASVNMSIIQQWFSRHANLLLVRTSPVKFSININHNGKFDSQLGVKDSYHLEADVFGYVSQPVVFTTGMHGLYLNSVVTISDVTATLTDALKLAISMQGQKVLFRSNAAVHNAVMNVSNTMGIQCMNFVLHGLESALNRQHEADIQRARLQAEKADDLLFKLATELPAQITSIARTGIAENATPQAINSAIKQAARAYAKALERVQQVGQNYRAATGLSAGEMANAPRLYSGQGQNARPAQLNAGRDYRRDNHGQSYDYANNRKNQKHNDYRKKTAQVNSGGNPNFNQGNHGYAPYDYGSRSSDGYRSVVRYDRSYHTGNNAASYDRQQQYIPQQKSHTYGQYMIPAERQAVFVGQANCSNENAAITTTPLSHFGK